MKTQTTLNVEGVTIEDGVAIYICSDEETAKRLIRKNPLARVISQNGKFAVVYDEHYFSPLGSLLKR